MENKIKDEIIEQEKSNKLNKNVLCGATFLATNLVIENAHASGVMDDFISAVRDMTAAIETDAPVFFTLGIVIVLALLVVYILFPKFRTTLHWIFGPIVGIIVVAVILQYFSDPIKNTFSSVFNIFSLLPSSK